MVDVRGPGPGCLGRRTEFQTFVGTLSTDWVSEGAFRGHWAVLAVAGYSGYVCESLVDRYKLL